MACRDICKKHRATKPIGTGRYESGQKRCKFCEIFVKWEGRYCPCCRYQLRTSPRNSTYKRMMREKFRRIS